MWIQKVREKARSTEEMRLAKFKQQNMAFQLYLIRNQMMFLMWLDNSLTYVIPKNLWIRDTINNCVSKISLLRKVDQILSMEILEMAIRISLDRACDEMLLVIFV